MWDTLSRRRPRLRSALNNNWKRINNHTDLGPERPQVVRFGSLAVARDRQGAILTFNNPQILQVR